MAEDPKKEGLTVYRELVDGAQLLTKEVSAEGGSSPPAEPSPGDEMVRMAGDYLRGNAKLMGFDLQSSSDLTALADAVAAGRLDLRLSEKKVVGNTVVITFEQYASGLPIYRASVTVRIDQRKHKVTGVQNALHSGQLKVHGTNTIDLKAALLRVTPEYVREAIGFDPESVPEISIPAPRALIYRFSSANRIGDPPAENAEDEYERSAAFPKVQLPKLPSSINDHEHFVVVEVLFKCWVKGWGRLNWRVFIEPETGSVLYLRALMSCVAPPRARIFKMDPASFSGKALSPASPVDLLDPLAKVVDLNVTRPASGDQELAGQYVRLSSASVPPLTFPMRPSPFRFSYACDTADFAACNAYHHCDATFRWFQGLGIDVQSVLERTKFPIWVDPLAFEGDTQAQAVADRRGILAGLKFGSAVAFTDFGLATDLRVVIHEIAHGFLMEHIGSPNFGFAHSAGDSLAAIMLDPRSKLAKVERQRGITFPFITTIPGFDRRHDLEAKFGWAWRGHRYTPGYPGEQILSSSLFRAYRAAGGDDMLKVEVREYASRRVCFLIVQSIATLASKPRTPQEFVDALRGADEAMNDFEGYPGGAYAKLFQWAFEEQGLNVPPSAEDMNIEGVPPGVDLYIDDVAKGHYVPYLKFTELLKPEGLWNRRTADGKPTHQAISPGVDNFFYLRIGNRGLTDGGTFTVTAFESKSATSHWPEQWKPVGLGAMRQQVGIPGGGMQVVGPFKWKPTAQASHLLVYVSEAGDTANIEQVHAAGFDLERFVRLDNNMLEGLFTNNRAWADHKVESDPDYFARLARQQTPKYLWIGCSDSRVPANEILGLEPGEVFVHRNIANLVVHSDMNCLAVLQYAVEILKVEHIMVVGHHGCGGVRAVADRRSAGLADNWLRHIEDIANKHEDRLRRADDEGRARRLVELNIVEQVANVCRTTILRRAWYKGQRIEVHGLVYGLVDGLLRRVGVSVVGGQAWDERYRESLGMLD